jgi:poly(A) polymerase
MIERDILKPVLPEIGPDGLVRLERLARREAEAGVQPHPLRRLAALLPADPEKVAAVAARLRLSNRAAKRLTAAAGRDPGEDRRSEVLAYAIGAEEAVDRILLGEGEPRQVSALAGWQRPRLRIGGGEIIAMGLAPGPVVARTLQAIEREWAEAGFPPEAAAQRAIARRHVDQALREAQ